MVTGTRVRPWWIALVVVAACSSESRRDGVERAAAAREAALPLRSPDALMAEMATAHADGDGHDSGPPPRADSRRFVMPPREAELGWVGDRGRPLDQRVEWMMTLMEHTRAVTKLYVVSASQRPVGTSLWSASMIRQSGWVTKILIDEFLPTISPDDPSYEVRMHGLGQLGEGGVNMVTGALMMFAQASAAERRRLASACSDHLADFTRIWEPAQCEQVADRLAAARTGERDDAVRRSLDRMTDQMRGCGTSAHP